MSVCGPAWTLRSTAPPADPPVYPPPLHPPPGPGTYEGPGPDRGPAWTMRSTTPRGAPDAGEPGADSPGPAHYDASQRSTMDGPAFTMRGKIRDPEPKVWEACGGGERVGRLGPSGS